MKYITPRRANEIIECICAEYLVTLEDVKGSSRDKELAEARQVIWHILYLHSFSISIAGRMFNRKKSTVLITAKKSIARAGVDKNYNEFINEFISLVEENKKI